METCIYFKDYVKDQLNISFSRGDYKMKTHPNKPVKARC